jgi:predicted MPP superfamily phosphohydrolase
MILIFVILLFNLYDWWRLKEAFFKQPMGLPSLALLIFIIFMAALPLTTRLCFGRNPDGFFAQASVTLAWLWLGWSFWMASIFLAMDCWNLVSYVVTMITAKFGSHPVNLEIPSMVQGCVAIGGTILLSVIGYFGALDVHKVDIELKSEKVPAHADGFKIAFISDLHLAPELRTSIVDQTISILESEKPDLILNGGDFQDNTLARERKLAARFAEIKPELKFSVLGNHEYYTGTQDCIDLHKLASFTLLRNEGVEIDDWLYVFGVDDQAINKKVQSQPPYDNDAAKDACNKRFAILLKHRPEPTEIAKQQFDLMLAGHSHGGQFIPFSWLVKIKYPLGTGLSQILGAKMLLYTTPGTGTWGPPFRIFTKSEVTIITLKSK